MLTAATTPSLDLPFVPALARLDRVTLVMTALVALVGWVVLRFSTAYLTGDPQRRSYFGRMGATLAAVTMVVLTGNLVVLVVAWAAASLSLHGLLTHFRDRPVALAVAHKKFLLARCADACMVGATIGFWRAFDTVRIDAIGAAAAAGGPLPTSARIAIALVAVAALLKCAQLPFHGWLIQVMEAPTPVSALLHAGVVNLGGFVLLRFAPVVDRATETRTLLVVVGAATAVTAGLVMTTRVSIKVALAWSTCAQMGFMLVQCGLGLWPLALLHLVAHSLYKAHAFLSAGGTVRQTLVRRLGGRSGTPTVGQVMTGVALAATATVSLALAWQALPVTEALTAPMWVLLGVVAVAVAPLATPGGRGVRPVQVAAVAGVPVAYLALHDLFGHLVHAAPSTPVALLVVVAVAFAALFAVQTACRVHPDGRLVRRLRPWVYSGFFLDDAFTRLAFAVSPPPAARTGYSLLPRPEVAVAVPPAEPQPAAGPVAHADGIAAIVAAACERIAPAWPLDELIAVNPYWGWREQSMRHSAGQLAVLAGTRLTMPRWWYRHEWQAGRLTEAGLREAASAMGMPEAVDDARRLLEGSEDPHTAVLQRMPLVTDLRDRGHWPIPGQTWTSLVVHQISQHCAAHADEWQASWAPQRAAGLFGSWRVDPSVTHGFRWHHGRRWAMERLTTLPSDPLAAIERMVDDLGVAPAGRQPYLTALLASVGGWAAWCAHRRWQARLVGDDDDTIVELLGVRLAWEWLLAADAEAGDHPGSVEELRQWAASWSHVDRAAADTADEQRLDWLLQTAIERDYQAAVVDGLTRGEQSVADVSPEVQAVFCIDVRSEVFRRALESVAPAVQTRGFAGFFGLPLAYTPAGSELTRPQLPGLLPPALQVTDACAAHDGTELRRRRGGRLQNRARWQRFRTDPSSMFSYVESLGLVAAAKLVRYSSPHRHAPTQWEREGLAGLDLRPRLSLVHDDPAAAAAIGKRVLTAMGLVDGFAPLVLLCGHGSTSANNPQAAALDCGACGGQTGEVNARVLADLLNDSLVRRELVALGVTVPDSTWFVPGLHDTTIDEVTLYDTDLAPDRHRDRIARLRELLAGAGTRARAERAPRLGLVAGDDDVVGVQRAIQQRANDWSQVRPEWGLAGNAAFVVAPRWRTRHLDLDGRSFLHDYDWQLDPELDVLTLIMTAPIVVTNWINMQYYASTVDNTRYGSGDKVLHNVVGGRVGLFEGNGGDLRIGLSVQSLHDGHELRHHPLRLSVFIEAPRAAIDSVIGDHAVARNLVLGGWLHLLRIDSTDGSVERRAAEGWEPFGYGAERVSRTTSGRE